MKRSEMPPLAKGILADGEFCYVAAVTPFGPHLTPVVYALDGGRLWLTTARGSVKARAWKTEPRVAGMVRVGERAVVFRGTVTTYDALDPFTWPSAVVSTPRIGRAATRFSMKNARFFFGYARDAYRVPLAWAPPGRVFAAVDPTEARVVDLAEGTVEDGWGAWARGFEPASSFAPASGARSVDALIPEDLTDALGASGDGVLATHVDTDGGALVTVVPVGWRRVRGAYEARLPMPVAELTRAGATVRAALTIDRASAWRAAEMRGILLRGEAETFAPGITKGGAGALRARVGDGEALVRLAPERAVWWEGWTSGTVARPAARRARPQRPQRRAAKAG